MSIYRGISVHLFQQRHKFTVIHQDTHDGVRGWRNKSRLKDTNQDWPKQIKIGRQLNIWPKTYGIRCLHQDVPHAKWTSKNCWTHFFTRIEFNIKHSKAKSSRKSDTLFWDVALKVSTTNWKLTCKTIHSDTQVLHTVPTGKYTFQT